MKVKAIVDWKVYKIRDKDIGDYRAKGEIWEVSKKRYEELINNEYTKRGFELVEEVKDDISDNTSLQPRRTGKKSN